jgi:hypothetical protein
MEGASPALQQANGEITGEYPWPEGIKPLFK